MKHGAALASDQRLIRELDIHGDRIIDFEAIRYIDLGRRLPERRAPLQQLDQNTKASPRPSSISSKLSTVARSPSPLKAKLERSATTKPRSNPIPLSSSPALPATESKFSKHNKQSSPESGIAQAEDGAGANGATEATNFMDHIKSQNPQFARYFEYNQARILEEKPQLQGEKDGVYNAAWLEWSHLDPGSRAQYYIKAEPTNELPESLSTLEAAAMEGDLMNEEQDDTEDAPKTFKLQSLVADASLELLETSVERGVKLLDQLREPLKDNAEHSPDVEQWIESLDKLQKSAVKQKTIIGVSYVVHILFVIASALNAQIDRMMTLGAFNSELRGCLLIKSSVIRSRGYK